jgi:CRP-like cAMP-binding protein
MSMGVPGKYRAALQALPLFAGLDAGHVDRVWDLGSYQAIAPGSTLMELGDLGMEAYLILEGTVQIIRADGSRAAAGPGELVGEMSLLENGSNRRNATVTALEPLKALVINRHYFQRLVTDEPLLHRHIVDRIHEYALEAAAAAAD